MCARKKCVSNGVLLERQNKAIIIITHESVRVNPSVPRVQIGAIPRKKKGIYENRREE